MKEVKDRKDYEENLADLIELLEDFRDSVSFLARDNRLLKKERDMYKSMYENIARLVYGEDYETKTKIKER
jgi:hypothetical protein